MMKEWIPIPGTSKDTLIQVALEEFSMKGYNEVNISELAKKANMTTGAVYHHFGSKANLYEVVRGEIEQRIIDRMEGAASIFEDFGEALKAAFITGLIFAVKQNVCKLLSESYPNNKMDRIEDFITNLNKSTELPIEIVLISTWRSILKGLAENQITQEQGIRLVHWVFKRESI
ncbi:helix-turn-helix domain-containing protein [Neobacillus niacini]|uniref:TetR/AcrR family transcriptional regulator n=1 Tax=Neobacillus niacini TaxID=86668 RepID=UPI002FFE89A5